VVAGAFVAGASGLATAAQTHARAQVSTTRCGNKYTPACIKPTIKTNPAGTKCVNPGSNFTLPSVRFTSNAGIRTIQIRQGSKVLKTIKFKGQGPTQYTLKGLAVSTLRLDAGGHPLTVKITDIKGRSTTKSLSFSVCSTTPKIVNTPPSAKCVSTGGSYKLPKVTFTSNSGLRSVQVVEGARTLKTVAFKSGVTQYTLNGVSVATLGLASGGHEVSLKVTDVKGRTASKTVHFTVCVSTPVFTG
jgi:ribosomal protein L28